MCDIISSENVGWRDCVLPKDEYGRELYADVVEKFRNAGALSKETAVDYTKIGICPETRKEDKNALNYLQVMNIVKRYYTMFKHKKHIFIIVTLMKYMILKKCIILLFIISNKNQRIRIFYM